MALIVPAYPNPYRPDAPIAGAFVRIGRFEFDRIANAGGMRMAAWFSQAEHDAGLPLLNDIPITFGADLGNGSHFPTLSEAMSDPAFVQIYLALKSWLEVKAMLHPALAGSTQV